MPSLETCSVSLVYQVTYLIIASIYRFNPQPICDAISQNHGDKGLMGVTQHSAGI
jgi:hypothetical protein